MPYKDQSLPVDTAQMYKPQYLDDILPILKGNLNSGPTTITPESVGKWMDFAGGMSKDSDALAIRNQREYINSVNPYGAGSTFDAASMGDLLAQLAANKQTLGLDMAKSFETTNANINNSNRNASISALLGIDDANRGEWDAMRQRNWDIIDWNNDEELAKWIAEMQREAAEEAANASRDSSWITAGGQLLSGLLTKKSAF